MSFGSCSRGHGAYSIDEENTPDSALVLPPVPKRYQVNIIGLSASVYTP